MRIDLEETVRQHPILRKARERLSLRMIVQLLTAVMLLVAARHFAEFVSYVRTGSGVAPVRPPVAEGFLPIAAILAFKAFLATRIIDPIHPAGLVIFIATVTTAWAFRRALCSWICPIGTFSEYLGKLGKKLMGRELTLPRWLDIGLLSLKYIFALLVFTLFFTLSGRQVYEFMRQPFYAVSDVKMFDMFTHLSAAGLVVILAIVVFSVFVKSFWCRYLCPYGAFLGVLGLLSPITLHKEESTCIGCMKCNQVCPNKVNVRDKNGVVFSPECTGCTSCVKACPNKGTLELKLLGLVTLRPIYFSLAFLGVFFGIILWAQLTGHWVTGLTLQSYRYLDRVASAGF
ncbi:MAG: 4Fe-4S binding protein [Chloroflexi bacterium]|nr:4Fe-4S binding protein [Chloroflexota bacterium]